MSLSPCELKPLLDFHPKSATAPEDADEDAELTKQLNKQRKKAIAAAYGWRRLVSSRNAYKDKGKGTMNSKIQRQAWKW
jgi:RIO kinase 2